MKSRVTDLKQAFKAGEAYNNECHCGKCDYCLDVKTEPAPDFDISIGRFHHPSNKEVNEPPLIVPKGYWNCSSCERDYETLGDDSRCPRCGNLCDMCLVEDHPVMADDNDVIYLDINDFSISEQDLERAFCFGYLANPENNPLDNSEMMRRYEVFKKEYLLPMLSRKGITD